MSTRIPPEAVAKAAQEGLAYREKFHRGGTAVGIARARQLANREELTATDIRRIYAYFARHEVDKKGKDFDNLARPSNGRIAWLLWGGEPGKEWVAKERARILEAGSQNQAV